MKRWILAIALILAARTGAAPPPAINPILPLILPRIFALPQSNVSGGGSGGCSVAGFVANHLISTDGAGNCTDAGFSKGNVIVGSTSGTQTIQASGANLTLNVNGGNSGASPALASSCALSTDATDCVAESESAAATNGTLTNGLANQAILATSTATNSTATPLEVAQGSITNTVATPAMQVEATWNNASLVGRGFGISTTNTSSAGTSLPFFMQTGGTLNFGVGVNGLGVFNGTDAITSTPPNVGSAVNGWKYSLGGNGWNVGLATRTEFHELAAGSNTFWLSLSGNPNAANDATGARPDSNAGVSIGTTGVLDFSETTCSATFTPTAGHAMVCPDSTQKAVMVTTPDASANFSAISRLVPSCLSVTPVTVNANVSTDQNLMACTLPANLLNVVGRTLRLTIAAIYSTPAASTSAITLKVKICSVSGCGSGNVLTAVNIVSAALGTIQVTNNAINLPVVITTQTAGAALAVEAHGCMSLDLNTSISGADTTYCDVNTGTQVGSPSNIDSTAQNFLQVTGAFSVASGSNSMSERMLIPEVLN